MKIKQKLISGIGLLFAMIVLLTIISIVCIHKLSKETGNILVANYNTLEYARNMSIALNNDITDIKQQANFLANLAKQQKNITEIGEKELTDKLAFDFNQLKNNTADHQLIATLRNDISDIMLLNMLAIERKSKIAGNTADAAILWVSLIGTLCFLIAFTLLINLPNNIANPIRELSDSIKEIAAENYSQRVHFESHNEFGDLATSFNTMAEKLEEYKTGNIDKLLIEKKRIETLINNMNEPVIGLDDTDHVVFMNNNALAITGLKNENLIGQAVHTLAAHNDLLRLLVQDMNGNPTINDKRNKTPVKIFANGKESYFEKELIPIKIIPTGERDEKLIGNVIMLKNITEYKELDFAKTHFIATISHELKTPIAAIQFSVQLLKNNQIGDLNDEQIHLLKNIEGDAGRLLKITGELLNMTQVESGVIQLNVVPSSAEEILAYAIHANHVAAEHKGIKIENHATSPLPKVLADSEKTAWVLTNILSNAIRFSYENATVDLDVRVENGLVTFMITDSGQGISPQFLPKIFDRYFRIPGTKKEGTGLGLSISKEFIEAQGGKIEVQSDFAKGSQFSVSLPVFSE